MLNFTVSSQATSEFESTTKVSPSARVFVVRTPMAPRKAMPLPEIFWRMRPWPPQQHVAGLQSQS